MSVVSGLWAEMDGGRKEGGGVMKGGSVLNSARDCVKGPDAHLSSLSVRETIHEKHAKSLGFAAATWPLKVSWSYMLKPKPLTHFKAS